MNLKHGYEVSVADETRCSVGEGPIWDAHNNCIYWVDILGSRIFRLYPESGIIQQFEVGELIGFVIPLSKNVLLGGLKSGLHKLTLANEGEVYAERIDYIDSEDTNIRFNDACYIPGKGLFACTMDMTATESIGKFFYYNLSLERITIDENYTIANGPGISPDAKVIYMVETAGNSINKKGIYTAILTDDRKIEHRRLLLEWVYSSSPDGIICDRYGNLWIGEFGGNVLRKFSSEGQLLQELPLPAWNITKPAFAGENERIIYVTSATLFASNEIIKKYPYTGCLLRIDVKEI